MSETDVDTKAVWKMGAGLIVGVLVLVFLLGPLLGMPSRKQVPSPPLDLGRIRKPLLENDPVAAQKKEEKEQTKRLHRYGWVNRGQGVVHIPIEKAMELLLEKGPHGISH